MLRELRRLRTYLRAAAGKDILRRPEVRVPVRRFGSDYGGWEVADLALTSSSIVYSFGIGEDASFDLAIIEAYGVTVHAFDPTPRSIEWVNQQKLPERFVLHEYGIAAFDGTARFHAPDNPSYVSHTIVPPTRDDGRTIHVPVKQLSTIMRELGHGHIDLLKMDIEGAEYDVIADIARSEIRPRQLLVEFHHRFRSLGVRHTVDALEMLRSMGYSLFAVSESNEEYSFIILDNAA